MLWTILWIILSFFALIGVIEFILCIMETISMYSTKSLKSVSLTVHMTGHEPHVAFLLDSLQIMAQRIMFNRTVTKVCVIDAGMDETSRVQVEEYVKRHGDVVFVENEGEV